MSKSSGETQSGQGAAPDLTLTIGDKNLSSWSMRPWILMTQAGIPFKEELVLFNSPGQKETLAARSPAAKVPVLRNGDLTIWDSLAIAEYLAELFPDKSLWPQEPQARAEARCVSAEMHSEFGALRQTMPMMMCSRVTDFVPVRPAVPDIARIESMWSGLRARHGAAGPFLFGGFSIADAMYAPVVSRFRTYGVKLSKPATAYCETIAGLDAYKAWEAGAREEVYGANPSPGARQWRDG